MICMFRYRISYRERRRVFEESIKRLQTTCEEYNSMRNAQLNVIPPGDLYRQYVKRTGA